ncbi:uncharacterized protein CXorf38 homolog isoform X2 [Dicentrarchus labrax]|uniref:uncharacterized protein CXorf38 homolog isoform X2 n=1 Tax=Dicentrarchus labrax TaxID=13489 RepID=UPI0021F5D527|nr:uncharacterized protein CXorf38 homolog isoform X2 [Dicentrarchus labrax]
MVLEELAARLNDREYKNWLKAGRCLLLLRDGLHPFISQRMRAFHADLINQNSLLRKPCESSSCRPRGTKAFMPRGLGKVKAADQCDASALLNLINYCDYFQSVDLKCVREVIRYRNELMHSCELRVKNDWMWHYETSLKNLVRQFSPIPQMARVGQQIEEMLAVDLSICVSGLDRMDSANMDGIECDSVSQWETSADLISQWETELLQERLQELLHVATAAAAEDEADDTKAEDTEQLKRLGGFLQANRDLAERFSTELKDINSLEARE